MRVLGGWLPGAIGAAVVLTASLVVAAPAAVGQAPAPLGLAADDAAASCWEIKQNRPLSANGVYWLQTPRLVAPEQFYCDMTTDGGGWVLIGRGREGWRDGYNGQGTPAQVRDVVTGTGAFTVRTLAASKVDGLLNGGRVDGLTDRIRVRRATNSTGTSWQEARFSMANRDRWVWTFGAEHRVGTFSFSNLTTTNGSGGLTNNFGTNTSFNRINMQETEAQGWTRGWAFGSSTEGTNSASTYLWSHTSGLGYARPFSQVYLRPRLTQANLTYPVIAAAGTAKQELSPLLQNGSEPQEWGVTGLANGRDGELNTEVQAFAQVGNTVYVGGNFRYVQRGENPVPGDRVEQSYLAAFDLATGAWKPDFRPTFNDQIIDLKALPNGKLIAAGEFSEVNGTARPGIVALNPTTGQTDPGWAVQMENRILGGSKVIVRDMAVKDGWLYVGGAFTHLAGGSRTSPAYARSGARVSVTDGTPDGSWNPAFNGTVVSIDASANGERLYAAGYFTQSNGQPANRVAVVSTAPGASLVPGMKPAQFSSPTGATYQQAIKEVGNRVWLGGAQHMLFSHTRNDFTRLSGNITKSGGDFQFIQEIGGLVYAGCHCNNWTYSEAYTWSNVGTDWTQADKIGFMGAWDPTTGAYQPDFNPNLTGRVGLGPWEAFEDSTGKGWFGGDFNRAQRTNGSWQWAGGFARYAPRDTTAPTTPTGLTSTALTLTTSRLSWNASSDDRGARSYEVMRGNRVIAGTTDTELVVPTSATPTRYWVRAIDSAGNRSASTPAITVTAPDEAPVAPFNAIAMGAQWRWAFDFTDRGTAWREPGHDDSGWNLGPARIGFNIGGEATVTPLPAPAGSAQPVTAYFRRTFVLPEPAARYGTLTLNLVRDDGAVVYVNGVEAVRSNMPEGTITHQTGAASTVTGTWNAKQAHQYTVPASALVDGTNTIAVEVHQNHAWGNDLSFDFSLTAT